MLSNIGSRKNSASRVYTYIYMGKQDIYIALKSKLLLRPRKYRVLDNFWIDSFLLFLTKLGEISVKLSSSPALFSLPVIRMKGGEHLVEKSRTRESLHLSIYLSISFYPYPCAPLFSSSPYFAPSRREDEL